MTRSAVFYFANLGADVMRCVNASQNNDEVRYKDSRARAYDTLEKLHSTGRLEAYEEGLLMLRGLSIARKSPETLASFRLELDSLIAEFFSLLAYTSV